jgi:hypothetical protein
MHTRDLNFAELEAWSDLNYGCKKSASKPMAKGPQNLAVVHLFKPTDEISFHH